MRRRLPIVVGLVAGVGFGWLTYQLGLAGLAITLVACALILFLSRVYIPYRMPWRTRNALLKELDPQSGPPDSAQPTHSDLFERMQAAARRNDWEGLNDLLAPDFAMIDARGRRWGAKTYVRTLQVMRRVYPDLRSETQEIVVDAAAPDVLWLRTATLGHPRRGPALDSEAWSKLTVTPDQQRARELANGGVLRVA